MRRSRRNASSANFTPITVKMKIVEILEGKRSSLKVKDLVPLLGISKSKLYQAIAKGELPSNRKGGITVDPNHVIAWWTQDVA